GRAGPAAWGVRHGDPPRLCSFDAPYTNRFGKGTRVQLGSGAQPAAALSWWSHRERRMPLDKIEHYLVLTDDIEATRDFYVEALGMRVGPRPPLGFPGYWVYVGDTPCIHIGEWRTYTEHSRGQGIPVTTRATGTGPVDHIAFHAHDYD